MRWYNMLYHLIRHLECMMCCVGAQSTTRKNLIFCTSDGSIVSLVDGTWNGGGTPENGKETNIFDFLVILGGWQGEGEGPNEPYRKNTD